jgi:hypothetical protein
MSEILEVIEPYCGTIAPRLKLRCYGCSRVYVACYWPRAAKRATACRECRPGPTKEQAKAAWMKAKPIYLAWCKQRSRFIFTQRYLLRNRRRLKAAIARRSARAS